MGVLRFRFVVFLVFCCLQFHGNQMESSFSFLLFIVVIIVIFVFDDGENLQRSWADCFGCWCIQFFWPKVVMRKWLNISAKESDYSADTDGEDDSASDSDNEEFAQWERESRFKDNNGDGVQVDPNDTFRRRRRRKSETFRAQYINTKELRICVGTWNVGGKIPPDDLDIDDWIDISEPADIYVIGLQEIVPLNAGNIFGAEDSRPVPKWENIIRETLNRIRYIKPKIKCYSDHPSPSRFKPFDEEQDLEYELSLSTDSEGDEEIHPVDEDPDGVDEINYRPVTSESVFVNPGISDSTDSPNIGMSSGKDFQRQFSSTKRLDRLSCLRTDTEIAEATASQYNRKLNRTCSVTERIGLSWPEPPLDLLARHVLERPISFKSFKSTKSLRGYSSFKSYINDDRGMPSDIALLADLDLESLMNRKRKSSFVRIVSKQMVGIFLTVWVRRSLRRRIQNVKVSTVGVGVMGYIGNKGSVSVSMSIYQTLFCFICTHLTSGEKDGDDLKRNADVHEIHRRTHFHSHPNIRLPKSIHDHERIIWLGDLNYRLSLSYEKTRDFISKKEWSKLVEKDQLTRELKRGRAFDGWYEGALNFPPTYKYEYNSDKYCGEDPKTGRRTPAWCDRILSYGKGLKLLSYRRNELRLSDHRPVTATYMAEVEVFSPRKLQRALTLTNAEIEDGKIVTDMEIDVGMSHLRLGENISEWDR